MAAVVDTHHQTEEEDTEEALVLHQGTTLAEESGEALSQKGMQPPVCTAPVALALKPAMLSSWESVDLEPGEVHGLHASKLPPPEHDVRHVLHLALVCSIISTLWPLPEPRAAKQYSVEGLTVARPSRCSLPSQPNDLSRWRYPHGLVQQLCS